MTQNVLTLSAGGIVTETANVAPALTSTATDIKMNGVQSAGSLTTVPKADHVHPVDTSRAADSSVVHNTGTETIAGLKSFSSVVTGVEGAVIGNSVLNTSKNIEFSGNRSLGGALGAISWYNYQWDSVIKAGIRGSTAGSIAVGKLVFVADGSDVMSMDATRLTTIGLGVSLDQAAATRLQVSNQNATAAGSAGIHLAAYGGGWYIDTPYALGTNPLTFYSAGAGTVFTLSYLGAATFSAGVTATTIKATAAAGYISSDGSTGITTTVTTASLVGKTITIKDGIITGFA